jgi:hypothetical protein
MDEERSWRGGNPGGDVPMVEVADLRAVWGTYQDFAARHPGKQVAVGAAVLEEACSQRVDIEAVIYRYWMLQMLEMCCGDLLAPWRQSGHFHEAVFRVAARIPMKWMEMGVPQQGLPFDVDLFAQELRKESQ